MKGPYGQNDSRYDLSHARDGAAPFGLRKSQNRRDQCARDTDTDKEDEICNIKAPGDGLVHPGHTEPKIHLSKI